MEFILVIDEPWDMDIIEEYWGDVRQYCEEEFTDGRLGKLSLPQGCDVKINVRDYTDWLWVYSDDGKYIPDGLMEWVKNVEMRVKS